MPAYMIAKINIHDAEQYKDYQRQVLPTIQQFDGKILSVETDPAIIEGDWACSYTVIIEWPSVERAKEWYDSDVYVEPKALRQRTSSADLVFMRGLPKPPR